MKRDDQDNKEEINRRKNDWKTNVNKMIATIKMEKEWAAKIFKVNNFRKKVEVGKKVKMIKRKPKQIR